MEYNGFHTRPGDRVFYKGGKAMAARESVKTKLNRLRWHSKQGESVPVNASALLRWSEAGIHFLLASVLTGAAVFEEYAPFGVALVGAAGSGTCGAAALLGAFGGYLIQLGFADGLRYAAAAILTFAVSFAFYDVQALRRPWAMPLLTALLNGCTGFVYLSQEGWRTVDVIYFATELILCAAAGWCYRQLLAPMRAGRTDTLSTPARTASLLFLFCSVLLALAPVCLYRDISLGRCLAVTAVLAVAWQGGCAAGTVLGISAGLALDLAANGVPMYAMALGLAGLAAGAFSGGRKLRSALAYVLVNGASVLWTWDKGLPISILYEAFLGSVVFLLLPQVPLKKLGRWLTPAVPADPDQAAQQRTRRRLEDTAHAFRTLYETMRSSFRPPRNDNDVATVFDRAACQVCRTCSLRSQCWERGYVTTFNALNDATQAMVERGQGEPGDFPAHFSSRCIHFPEFLAAVNRELTALLYRRQYNSRIQESRWAVCRQYAQLSSVLEQAAAQLGEELIPDPVTQRKLQGRLALLDDQSQGSAFRDGRGLLRLEVVGPAAAQLAQPQHLGSLIQLLGLPLRVEEQEEERLVLIQQEPLMAVAGVAARKKDGETVSGDGGTYFKREDGTLYVLLCDGMGSGLAANRESSLALRLLEQFLQAGVDTEHALTTLNSALALRGEETGGFTTVDLLQLDLFTGDGVIFKLGAAPTYVKKGETVRRITAASLPAGLEQGSAAVPDRTPIHLSPGDCVLMISDGVAGPQDDQWLRDRFLQFKGDSPKELARDLIANSPQQATDDRTAMVVRISSRQLS